VEAGRWNRIYKQFRISRIVWNFTCCGKCNGSGDCRKLPSAGGTLCPSYRATEMKRTPRARANALREYLTHSEKTISSTTKNCIKYLNCVCCKACASECPSNVDIAAMKSGFYTNIKSKWVSWRNKVFAFNAKLNGLNPQRLLISW
jgi:Fe-S oxidoreductase